MQGHSQQFKSFTNKKTNQMAETAAPAKGMSKSAKTWLIVGIVVVVLVVAGVLIYQYWYKPMQDEKDKNANNDTGGTKKTIDTNDTSLIKTLAATTSPTEVQAVLARVA